MTDANLTTRDVADALNINPRDLRIFLRAQGDTYTPPGSGGRYTFTKSQIAPIKKAYTAFLNERAKAKEEKEKEKARALAVVAEETAQAIADAS